MRSWEYNRFGVLMGASSLASCPRWPSLRGYSWPMITLFSLQGDFCATAIPHKASSHDQISLHQQEAVSRTVLHRQPTRIDGICGIGVDGHIRARTPKVCPILIGRHDGCTGL